MKGGKCNGRRKGGIRIDRKKWKEKSEGSKKNAESKKRKKQRIKKQTGEVDRDMERKKSRDKES